MDPLGRKMEEQAPDQWPARSGVALALAQIAPLLPREEIATLFDFYVPKALGDRSPEVRSHMRDAALAAINSHGKVKMLSVSVCSGLCVRGEGVSVSVCLGLSVRGEGVSVSVCLGLSVRGEGVSVSVCLGLSVRGEGVSVSVCLGLSVRGEGVSVSLCSGLCVRGEGVSVSVCSGLSVRGEGCVSV